MFQYEAVVVAMSFSALMVLAVNYGCNLVARDCLCKRNMAVCLKKICFIPKCAKICKFKFDIFDFISRISLVST